MSQTRTERIQHEQARHERRVQRMCAERGLEINTSGTAWCIKGPGIHIKAADLSIVTAEDLDPKTKTARWN